MKKVVVVLLAALFSTSCGSATQSLSEPSVETVSPTTTSSAVTTSPTTTTVPTYTGPLYPQLFIDVTDEESCSEIGGTYDYGPPGWEQYCRPDRFSLASNNSDLCEQLRHVWNEEQQRCNKVSDWDRYLELKKIEEENACIDRGGVWALGAYDSEDFGCRYNDGTVWTAYSEDVCLERGGTWTGTNDYTDYRGALILCYEDDGSLWDAHYQDMCIDRGGSWDPDRGWHIHPEVGGLYSHCFEDLGGPLDALDHVTCGARGGIWKIDPHAYYRENACFSYETEYELEDLFDSGSDWKNVVLRNWEDDVLHNCENRDETLNQLSGFIINRPWLELLWEVDDFSCRDLTSQPFEDLPRSFRSMVNEQGEETIFYVLTWPWADLMEVLDIDGPGFAEFARIHDISSKGDVLFGVCDPCWSSESEAIEGLFIMSSDGTNRRRLFMSCYRYCAPSSFSPDGESFLQFETYQLEPYNTYNGSISTPLYQFDLEGNLIRTLNPDTDSQTIIEAVSVSPSGTHIAYWETTNPVLRPNLFVTDFEGSPVQQLTDFDPMDFYSFSIFGIPDSSVFDDPPIVWSLDETQIGFCIQHKHTERQLDGSGWRSKLGDCQKQFAVSTSASSTKEIEEISLETYELWANQQL